MTRLHTTSQDTRLILHEIQELRRELTLLREETQASLSGVRALFDEIRHVEAAESSIEMELGQMAERVGQVLDDQRLSLTSCDACGSAIERHQARNGILLICKACGHTAFVDRRKTSDRRDNDDRRRQGQAVSEGMPAPSPSDSFDWTRE